MRKVFLLLCCILLAASCGPKAQYKKMILDYLQENTNGENYTIIEISEPDSLYSPGEVITSLMIRKSERYAELSKQLSAAYDKPTFKERRAAVLEVAKLADAEYNDDKDLDLVLRALTDRSFDERSANRVTVKAKYKVNGLIREDVFYKEANFNAIGSSASRMLNSYRDLCDLYGNLYSLKREAENTAKTIR